MYIFFLCLSVYQSFLNADVYVQVCLCLGLCLCIYDYVYLDVSVAVCPNVCFCLSVCLAVCQTLSLSHFVSFPLMENVSVVLSYSVGDVPSSCFSAILFSKSYF